MALQLASSFWSWDFWEPTMQGAIASAIFAILAFFFAKIVKLTPKAWQAARKPKSRAVLYQCFNYAATIISGLLIHAPSSHNWLRLVCWFSIGISALSAVVEVIFDFQIVAFDFQMKSNALLTRTVYALEYFRAKSCGEATTIPPPQLNMPPEYISPRRIALKFLVLSIPTIVATYFAVIYR